MVLCRHENNGIFARVAMWLITNIACDKMFKVF